MPTTITRSDVQSALRIKEVSVSDLKADPTVSAEVKARLATADINHDGVISGTTEVDKLFDAADAFDKNGNRNSVTGERSPGLPSLAAAGLQAAVAKATPRRGLGNAQAPATVTRTDTQNALAGKQVTVAAINASGLTSDVRSKLVGADINNDGVIRGRAEVEQLFNAADAFDKNGNRDSVVGSAGGVNTKAGQTLTTAVNLSTAQTASPTMTRAELHRELAGKEVAVGAFSGLASDVRSTLVRADQNGDGFIRGGTEIDRLFSAADDFDNNGKRDSVVGSVNGMATKAGAGLTAAITGAASLSVHVDTELDDSFRQFRDVDVGALQSLLPSQARPLASAFVTSGERYDVDPLLLASISKHETANWTSSAFINKNNAMGVSDSSGPIFQTSHAASIDKMASLIGSTTSGPYQNAETYRDLWSIYAPGPTTGQGRQQNDPTNLNRSWGPGIVANINSYSSALR